MVKNIIKWVNNIKNMDQLRRDVSYGGEREEDFSKYSREDLLRMKEETEIAIHPLSEIRGGPLNGGRVSEAGSDVLMERLRKLDNRYAAISQALKALEEKGEEK